MGETITSLIEKLEGAEVGSNRLSDEVLSACGYAETRFPMDSCTYWVHPSAPKSPLSVAQESVTTSLDAALALAERIVGGKEALLLLTDLLTREAAASDFDSIRVSDLPRLLCAAILRAHSEAR